MFHSILDSTLTTREEPPHPLCTPTSGLTYGAMMAMLDLSKKAADDRVTAFIGPSAHLRMEKFLDVDQLAQIKLLFDIRTDHLPPRHDFVGGYWKQRDAGTIEYVNACYEDAIFACPEDKPFAVLRFARLVQFDNPEPCWSKS